MKTTELLRKAANALKHREKLPGLSWTALAEDLELRACEMENGDALEEIRDIDDALARLRELVA